MSKGKSGVLKFVLVACPLFLFNLFLVINNIKHDPKDTEACEKAMEASSTKVWRAYLDEFPNGWCVLDAEEAIKREEDEIRRQAEAEAKAREEQFYKETIEKNTLDAWENYLREFPEGVHAFEAKFKIKELSEGASEKNEPKPDTSEPRDKPVEIKSESKKNPSQPKVINKPVPVETWSSTHYSFPTQRLVEDKPVQRKTWSSRSPHAMTWKQAVAYCKNLEEDWFTDWRLPNIDELRKLVRNCPQAQTNGSCEVSQKNNCLSLRCSEPEDSCGCDRKSGNVGYYSKLGDNSETWLWSSSTRSDNPEYAWILSFLFGGVYNNVKVFNFYVRCIR